MTPAELRLLDLMTAEIERLRSVCPPAQADLSRIRMGWRQQGSVHVPISGIDATPDGFAPVPGESGVWRFDSGTWIRWLMPV